MTFKWNVRVYYEDTDAGGLVYHTKYLNFLERARTEWLRTLGCEQNSLRTQHQVIFVVKSMSVEYLKSASFNDMLEVKSDIVALKKASVDFSQTVMRSDEVLLSAELTIVCVDANVHKPVAIPSHLFKEFNYAK